MNIIKRFSLGLLISLFLSISTWLGNAVLIFITPFRADEPYRADDAPLITST